MMKMATGEGSPLRQGAGTGLDWFSVATEAFGGETPDLLCSPDVFRVYGYIWEEEVYQWISGCPRGRAARLPP